MKNNSRSADFQSAVPRTCSPQADGISVRNRGYLPHFEMPDGRYFVTFRLADSLPQEVYRKLQNERQQALNAAQNSGARATIVELNRVAEAYSLRLDAYLDEGKGSSALRNAEAAQIVADALHFFDCDRYRLHAWCVMPNHVHAVLQPLGDHGLSKIMQSLKRFTAREINRISGKTGGFWQPEYYDHLIRDENDLWTKIRYVLENPARAGLRDWPWSGAE
jgi:REP element-mobilizing transposase RayT